MAFDISTLVTDRKQSDVVYVKQLIAKIVAGTATESELAEWSNHTLKGAYNYTDLNRVNSAMEYLVSRLRGYGYAVRGYERDNTVWTMTSIPHPAQMNRYVGNVAAIRRALAMLPTTPTVPAKMENLTVREANAIEQILVDVETVIKALERVFLYSGQPMFFSGFAIYSRRQTHIRMPVITADDLRVYTADGLPVFLKEEIPYG